MRRTEMMGTALRCPLTATLALLFASASVGLRVCRFRSRLQITRNLNIVAIALNCRIPYAIYDYNERLAATWTVLPCILRPDFRVALVSTVTTAVCHIHQPEHLRKYIYIEVCFLLRPRIRFVPIYIWLTNVIGNERESDATFIKYNRMIWITLPNLRTNRSWSLTFRLCAWIKFPDYDCCWISAGIILDGSEDKCSNDSIRR